MSDHVIVRSSSVEAARALVRRNSARGRATDKSTVRLAGARFVGRSDPAETPTNGHDADAS